MTETAAHPVPSPSDAPEAFLRCLFDVGVAAADPMRAVPAALPPRPAGRVVVLGAGKASARMAEAVESAWGPCEGLVITRYGYARPTQGVEIVEAAHPVPDESGARATARMLALLEGLGEDDFVLALISGGGSALLIQPAGEISLAEKQKVNADLLASGAPIGQMNTLRKHLSRVKGGQLAAAAFPARMLALMISDVPGDDPAFIASGPTVGDRTTPADASAILARWRIEPPAAVARVLAGKTGVLAPDDPRLARVENRVIAAPSQSLEAAAGIARAAGCRVEILGDALEGEARDLAADHARLALDRQAAMARGDAPLVLLSGGECTVTRRGDGVGGPNAEYALALAVALNAAPGIHAIACDTDGVDGAAEVAGAVIGPGTLARAHAAGCVADAALAANDSHGFFAALGDQVIPGPTLTNVNDFRAILILPPR
ncbi:glycerate kinase type-2 family protein [Rhodovulum euryhalinum]|uniref:Hydroxypyruvate reductase n=1 Tax=Rhodovulum euryhalinum TaxID=35805 RepID=A0A4R2KMV5_9RHOB|nr:glycerate kinase [Rhodovulum euryhalinum]TCO73992.1 hydroxypyruvate reductase [Rhodovulum euryhalinum]